MNVESRHRAACQCGRCPLRIIDKKLDYYEKLATTDRAEAEKILEARKAQLLPNKDYKLEARITELKDRMEASRDRDAETYNMLMGVMDKWEASALQRLSDASCKPLAIVSFLLG